MGGKLHVFLSCLPKVGSKALAVRDMGSKVSDKEPLKSMQPGTPDYRRLAESAAESMVHTDLSKCICADDDCQKQNLSSIAEDPTPGYPRTQ